MKPFSLLALAICLLPFFGISQNPKPDLPAKSERIRNPKSTSVAHFDRPFYISGEVVWFKIYWPKNFDNQDFTARLELFNEKGTLQTTAFLQKKDGEKGQSAFSEGQFSIPFDHPSGLLRFHFSALDSLLGAVDLLDAELPIFNDLAENTPLFLNEKKQNDDLFKNDLDLKIEFEKDPINPQENTVLKISAFEKNGQKVAASASVSVVDAVLTKQAFDGPTLFFGPEIAQNLHFLNGIWRGGTVFLKNDKPLVTPLLPLFDCETGNIEFTATDEKGHFWLQLPAFSGQREWQILEREGRQISIIWDTRTLPAISDFGFRISENLGSGTSEIQNPKSEIRSLSRQRKKIYSLFGAVETELVFEKPPVEKRRIEARKSYDVQDFERFRTMQEFFREVSTIIRFEEKKDGFEARLYNTSRMSFFDIQPLFFVDGRATFDADFVGKIDPATIRHVDLVTDQDVLRKAFPALGGGGAVIIESLKSRQNLPPTQQKNVFSMPGLAFSTRFPPEKANSKKPKIGPSVFWQPDFLIDEKAEPSRLEFRQNDDRSRFQIEVVARSADGKMARARLEYSVD